MFLARKGILRVSYGFIQPCQLLRTRRMIKAEEDLKLIKPIQVGNDIKEENPISRHPQDILKKIGVKRSKNLLSDQNVEVASLKLENDTQAKEKKLTAKQIAENLRHAKKKYALKKSIGHPIVSSLNHVQVAKLLRQGILYADENLVILNKPYGLVAHDGDKVPVSLRSCLPILSKMIYGIDTSVPLYMCNRLDKSTTGITVCVTNKDLLHEVTQLFRTQSIRKKYWAVTLSAPTPHEGVVDIPITTRDMSANLVGKKSLKMALAPEQRLDSQTGEMVKVRPKNCQVALTYYRILDRSEGVCFLELQPFTTVKHQMRVHLSEGLNCPILGDHKYSKQDNLSPQILPKSVLSKFRMARSESRNLPMHLHLRELLIPGILDNSEKPNLLVSAKVSSHFYRSLKLFKFKPGTQSEFKYPRDVLKTENLTKSNNPKMEDLYHDPFLEPETEKTKDELQRDDCYTVYTPKVKVKFN